MGSIIARSFVEKYPDIAQGLILTGTGMFPKWKGVPIRLAMKLVTFIFGKRRRLKWVNQLLNKTFNKKSLNLEQIVIGFLHVRMKLINLWKMNFVDSKYLISSFIKL